MRDVTEDRETALARLMACQAHRAHRDKAGRPYIEHVLRVADLVAEGEDRIVALLHDVVEDSDEFTLDQIDNWFGDRIAGAVAALTRNRHEHRDSYLERLMSNPIAVRVKLADLYDNSDPARLALLDPATAERLSAKYDYALTALVGMAVLPVHTAPPGPRVIGVRGPQGDRVPAVCHRRLDDGPSFTAAGDGRELGGITGWTPMAS